MGRESYSQDELDNHANQLNDNNDAYYQSRGHDSKDDYDDDDDRSDDDDDNRGYDDDDGADGGWGESSSWE